MAAQSVEAGTPPSRSRDFPSSWEDDPPSNTAATAAAFDDLRSVEVEAVPLEASELLELLDFTTDRTVGTMVAPVGMLAEDDADTDGVLALRGVVSGTDGAALGLRAGVLVDGLPLTENEDDVGWEGVTGDEVVRVVSHPESSLGAGAARRLAGLMFEDEADFRAVMLTPA